MKKFFIITSLLFCHTIVHAQLKVDSVGHVGIGLTNGAIQSLLSIKGGNPNYLVYVNADSKNGIAINNAAQNTSRMGVSVMNQYRLNYPTTGIQVFPNGGSSNVDSYGIQSYTGVSTGINIGVWGGIVPISVGSTKQAGIYGSSSSSNIMSYPGQYAGYFNGDTRVTGAIYGLLLTPSSSPNNSSAINIEETEEPVLSKLMQVKAIRVCDDMPIAEEQIDEELKINLQNAGYEVQETITPVQTKMSQVKYALATKELRDIFPELVYEDEGGNISINYIELIPLLVQSIKELNSKLEASEAQVKENELPAGISDEMVELITLDQNKPNPFSDRTSIKLSIPKSVTSATLFIYDMTGKQVKQTDISDRGNISIEVTSEGLVPGMYLYSLIADGKVISTKRMILAN